MATIYVATSRTSGKSYVGKTKRPFSYRKRAHQREAEQGSQKKFHRAIRKYGFDDFTWEVRVVSADILDVLEIALIAELDTFQNGYNATTGGDGGFKHSAETREEISVANKGYKHSEEACLNRSRALAGKPHSVEWAQKVGAALRGKQRTPEARTRMSDAHVGKPLSDYHRQRISEGQKGRRPSEATRAKLRASATGRQASLETRRKISEANSQRVITDETRQRMRAAHLNPSAEHRQKLSDAQRKRWAKAKGRNDDEDRSEETG
jgi:group I intron endonuclease